MALGTGSAVLFVPNPLAIEVVKRSPAFEAAMAQIGEAGVEVAKRLVPVDTGALRDSIHMERLDDGGVAVVAGTGHWGEGTFYWFFVEFGTSKMAASPFLRPVIDELGLKR